MTESRIPWIDLSDLRCQKCGRPLRWAYFDFDSIEGAYPVARTEYVCDSCGAGYLGQMVLKVVQLDLDPADEYSVGYGEGTRYVATLARRPPARRTVSKKLATKRRTAKGARR